MSDANLCLIDAYRALLSGEADIAVNTQPRIHRCERNWRWAPLPLKDYDLWCVLSGSGTLAVDGRQHPLRAGSCFVIPPGAQPRGAHNPADPLTVFATHFDIVGAIEPPAGTFAHLAAGAAFVTILAERCEEAARSGGAIGARVAKSLVRQIMLHLYYESEQPARREQDRIGDLCAAITREPGAAWSVDAMAEYVCLSRSQLTRRLRSRTALSPMEFVIQKRMERSRQLLVETPMKVVEIAEALGIESVFYFSRAFKRRYGVSPRAYRDAVRGSSLEEPGDRISP